MEVYQGKIRLVIKNFPYKYRTYSYLAAQAFLAAAKQNKGWEMYKLLLEKSPTLDRTSLIKYANTLNLDIDEFRKALDHDRYKKDLNDDKIQGLRNDVFNTPTFFINGQMVVGARTFEYLSKIVDEELKNAQ